VRAVGGWMAAAAAAAALSCNWTSFDDLKSEAWVGIAEREDTETGGDYGVEILAMPPAAGEQGIRYVIAVGNPLAGMAEATFDATGALLDQIGQNGRTGGSGALEPLTDTSVVFALKRYTGETYLAGAPAIKQVVKFEMGLANGMSILTNGAEQSGRAIAIGNLGFGSANPDVVTLGLLSLTIIKNGSMAPVTCNMKPPNASQSPVIPLESLAVANVITSTPHDEIIVGHINLNNEPRILVIDPTAIQNGQNCPETIAFTVANNPPVSIQIAQLDGATTPLDMVTGTLRQGNGRVDVFMNPNWGQSGTPTPTEIPAPDSEEPSGSRGSRIRLADIEGDAGNEIIVGDPGATVENVSNAGKVQVYKPGACAGGGEVRGPACLIRTVWDDTPATNDQFGRALAVGPFTSSKGMKTILAVAEKTKLWVYFRISSADTDPRD